MLPFWKSLAVIAALKLFVAALGAFLLGRTLGMRSGGALLTGLETGPFDWIVIDTPPVLAVTDAMILAPLVSAVTFVIGAEMTRLRLAERAVETMLSSNPRLVLAVLNKVDVGRNKYYYSRYYGHQYKNYYAESPAA